VFHHGHQMEEMRAAASEDEGSVHIIGHFHPAHVLSDGAGLRLKLPAFVQSDDHWTLPAFSPWAGGARYTGAGGSIDSSSRIFAIHPRKIMRMGSA